MYRNVYVITSYFYQSGGTESAHQLVGKLNDMGVSAYIYYYDRNGEVDIPLKFSEYNINVAHEIEDNVDNLLIVPETLTEYMFEFQNIQKAIWWLSLNYYLYQFPNEHAKLVTEKYEIPSIFAGIIQRLLKNDGKKRFTFDSEKNNYFHFYNCEYARMYLEKNGILNEKLFYLCGPIRTEFFEASSTVDVEKKENIVLYNPNKGYFFVKRIIRIAEKEKSNFKFVPIKNMTTGQIIENMSKAKLYIDLGDFPGPERIPREAVTMKCNIICAKVGSCCNDIDYPISEKYKVDRRRKYIKKLFFKLCDEMEHYLENLGEFDLYRDKVIKQNLDMNDTIKNFFES